jgi:hypothetical protein
MPGLGPGIHAFLPCGPKDVDGRDKPGHDGDGDNPPSKRHGNIGQI